jgi:small subunit ribosomal protein S1
MEEEEDFATLLDASFRKDAAAQELTKGVIVVIKDDNVIIDIGQKSEGRIPVAEITDKDGTLLFAVGDTIDVVITHQSYERPYISHKKAIGRVKFESFAATVEGQDETVIEGVVTASNKGGYIVESDEGTECFLPRSMASFRENEKEVIGKRIKAAVVKVDRRARTLVISRKKLLDQDRRKRRQAIKDITSSEGNLAGTIKKITSYGMFVDVGGVEGLVHYSEISYKGPVNPADHYSVGDVIDVKVIGFDKEKKRLSLSVKATIQDPWGTISSEIEAGDQIRVTVSNIENYGAFVDLGNDIEGFLHVSELSWQKNLKHPKDVLTVGDEIDVEVIELDSIKRKLRVSLKKLIAKPFDEFLKAYKIGDVVKGSVSSLVDFGAFVKIGGVEGLLHNEDFSWNKQERCNNTLVVDQEVEVEIIKIDPSSEKISLGRKSLTKSPVELFMATYSVGDSVAGKVRDKKDFGVFVSLAQGVDALVRLKEFTPEELEALQIGDTLSGPLLSIDPVENKVRMGIVRAEDIENQTYLSSQEGGDFGSLAEAFKGKVHP